METTQKLYSKKGFTLIELIVVMVILGILALIMVPRMIGFQDGARASTCMANQRTLDSITAFYQSQNAPTFALPAGNSTAEILGRFVDMNLLDNVADADCPSNGTLSMTANGRWTCTVEGAHSHVRPNVVLGGPPEPPEEP